MSAVISLRDLVGEFDIQANETHAYVNKTTGEVLTLLDEYLSPVEDGEDWRQHEGPAWEKELLPKPRRF